MLEFLYGWINDFTRFTEALWERSIHGWQEGLNSLLGIAEIVFNTLANWVNTFTDWIGLSGEGLVALLVLLVLVIFGGVTRALSAAMGKASRSRDSWLKRIVSLLALGGVGTVALGLTATYFGVGFIWQTAIALIGWAGLPTTSGVSVQQSLEAFFTGLSTDTNYPRTTLRSAAASVTEWIGFLLYVFAVKVVLQITISSWVARFIVSRVFLNFTVGGVGARGAMQRSFG